ncbi:hypothetical protein BC936DRAFT_148031, partial [Jimgerdemannia flammicorona]
AKPSHSAQRTASIWQPAKPRLTLSPGQNPSTHPFPFDSVLCRCLPCQKNEMALTKCCCCIPLRAGAFIIALWFLVVNGFEAISGFIGRNTIISYAGQTSVTIYWVQVGLSVLIAVGGLFGLIGSCCASRGFIAAFSIITWISCSISIFKHVGALILMVIHRNEIVDECTQNGFSLNGNSTWTNGNATYSPVIRPNTLNNSTNLTEFLNGTSTPLTRADCQKSVEIVLIVAGVLILFVELLQVRLP